MKKSFLATCFIVLMLLLGSTVWANSVVTFAWDANTEEDLVGYRLYQTNAEGVYNFGEDNAVAIIPAGTETVVLSNITDGAHWWVLTAYDFNGNESVRSNEVGTMLDTVAPAAPTIRLISVEVQ